MADNKPKTDRKDGQAYDKSEFNDTYGPDIGDVGGQAGGTAGRSDLVDDASYRSDDFYAEDETK